MPTAAGSRADNAILAEGIEKAFGEVQAFGFIWMFPLTFVSAAFVPIASMPGWLQASAKNQPISIFIEEMRALAVGGPLALHAWQSAAWLAGIFAVFGFLATRAYRRA